MIRVLIISDLTGGPGGVYTYLRQIEHYTSDSISIKILLDSSTSKLVKGTYDLNKAVFIPLSTKIHNTELILTSVAILIREYQPNVIHIVNGSIKSNLVIREFLTEKRIPFIVTEQLIDNSLQLGNELLKRISMVNRSAKAVIYVSKENSRIAKEKYNQISENTTVIYNAIEPFKIKKSAYSKQPYRIFSSCRCVEQKGIDVIIKAIALLSEPNIDLYILGEGHMKDEYASMAKKLFKSKHKLTLKGWLNSADYIALFDCFDLYISASYQEGFSYSLLEAASAGFPIICSDCSGNKELIELHNLGELFQVGNEKQLSILLGNYFKNPQTLHKKAVLNSAKVDNTFNINQRIVDLENVYIQVYDKYKL